MPNDLVSNLLTTFAVAMIVAFAVGVIFYIYLAITLMIIARKTDTPNGWMAWLPIFNIFLMCFIGRRSGWWFLALLVPVLNIFVVAMLWASIAAARGKPSWTGALMIVPPFPIFIPAYLAMGSHKASATPSGNCTSCGAASEGQPFCGNCGKTITAASAGPLSVPIGRPMLAAAAMVLISIGVLGAGGYFLFGSPISYSPPVAKQIPAASPAMTGTLTELPIDTDPANPAVPVAMKTQTLDPEVPPNFPPGTSPTPARVDIPAGWLPPGIDTDRLPGVASVITSAAYTPQSLNNPSAPGTAGTAPSQPGEDQVYVHVISSRSQDPNFPNSGDPNSMPFPGITNPGLTIRRTGGPAPILTIPSNPDGGSSGDPGDWTDTVIHPEGTKTTTRVQGADGTTYSGTTTRNGPSTTYVLKRPGIVIIIYVPTQKLAPIGERLAKNVGNAKGLAAPSIPSALGTLPAKLPPGMILIDASITATSGYRKFASGSTGKSGGLGGLDPKNLPIDIQQIVPDQTAIARYRDASKKEWNAMVLDYSSPRAAKNVWTLFRWTIGMKDWMSQTVSNTSGLTISSGDESVIIFQKGPFIVIIGGPASALPSQTLDFANAFQL